MVDPALVVFAIQAGVRIGRKVYDVLVDSTREAPLYLPLGSLVGNVSFAAAREFFDQPAYRPLIAPGGPYAGADTDDERLVRAYATVQQLGRQLGDDPADPVDAARVVAGLGAFQQVQRGLAAKPAVQRILGTIVEIGIDYFAARPDALARRSPARGVVEAFVAGLDGVDFAEGDLAETARAVAGVSLGASLEVLGGDRMLLARDPRVRVVVGGVTTALTSAIEQAGSLGQAIRLEQLARRAAGSMISGAAGAVADNPSLFIPGDAASTRIVRAVVGQVLDGVRERDDLFTPDTLEQVVRGALVAAADQPGLAGDHGIVGDLLRRLAACAPGLLPAGAVALVTREAFRVLAAQPPALLAAGPRGASLARGVEALAVGLGRDLGAPAAPLPDLLTTPQLARLARSVLDAVAADGGALIGDDATDVARTLLAQALASVRAALAGRPPDLIAGDALADLLQVAVDVAADATDAMIDRTATDPTTNRLYGVLAGLTAAATAGDAPRLLRGPVLVATARRVLAVVAAGAIGPLRPDGPATRHATEAALALASGALAGEIDRATIAPVVAGLLRRGLEDGLPWSDQTAVSTAAREVLRAVA